MITPDKEQEEAIQAIVAEAGKSNGALNASLYGSGKTLMTVEAGKRLGGKVNVIITPLSVRYSWEAEIKQQIPGAKVYQINARKAGKEALERLSRLEEGWYIVGREYAVSAGVLPILTRIGKNIDFMAYDEIQKISNHKSKTYRSMMKVKPKFRLGLSATPAGNKFKGMYSITRWIWPDLVPRSFWVWVKEWARTELDYFAGTVVTGEKVPGAYVKSLPCFVRVLADIRTEDGTEVTLENYDIVVELTPRERKHYDQMEKFMVTWLEDNPLVTALPIVKKTRLRQMTLGVLSFDPETDEVVYNGASASTKYNTLVEYIKENPEEPVLVLTDSKKYARFVANKLVNSGYKACEFTGDLNDKEKEEVKTAFIDGEVDYIVATITSIGEGTNGLQWRANTMIWLSVLDGNHTLNGQAERRLFRRGQKSEVVKSIRIVAKDTLDQDILSENLQKQLELNRSLNV